MIIFGQATELNELSSEKKQIYIGELPEQKIQSDIYDLFNNRESDDLLLLYFSGHALINSKRQLFFAATDTKKYEYGGELIESTAIPASFIRQRMDESKSEKKVVILDCCFTGAFKNDDVTQNTVNTVNIEAELGSKGRTIFASSNSIDYPFKEDKELSVYTTYLLEGIETGEADFNQDGWITLAELDDFIRNKIKEKYPNMIPQFYSNQKDKEIRLAKVDQKSNEKINNLEESPLFKIELQTQRRVDYTRLRELLVAKNWKEADIETRKVMRLAAGKEDSGHIVEEDINQISCLDLSTIDSLWYVSSNGQFGFSTQKKICRQLLQKIDYETECELGEKLKWRVNNSWLIHSQLTFNLRAPKGHLPCLGVSWVRLPGSFGGLARIPVFSYLLQRFTQCE